MHPSATGCPFPRASSISSYGFMVPRVTSQITPMFRRALRARSVHVDVRKKEQPRPAAPSAAGFFLVRQAWRLLGWAPLRPFWGNYRVGGDSGVTRSLEISRRSEGKISFLAIVIVSAASLPPKHREWLERLLQASVGALHALILPPAATPHISSDEIDPPGSCAKLHLSGRTAFA